jgi:pimeloyl-ACP methyl ester carboxylesterase
LFNTEIPGHRAPYQQLYKFLAKWLPGYCAIAGFQLTFPAYLCSRQGFGGTLFDHRHLLAGFNERFIAPLTQSPHRMDAARRSFIALLNWNQLDALHRTHQEINAETLFIWGRQDNTFPERLGMEMSRSFRKLANFISIDQAKLYVHEDQPERVIESLASFMAVDVATSSN